MFSPKVGNLSRCLQNYFLFKNANQMLEKKDRDKNTFPGFYRTTAVSEIKSWSLRLSLSSSISSSRTPCSLTPFTVQDLSRMERSRSRRTALVVHPMLNPNAQPTCRKEKYYFYSGKHCLGDAIDLTWEVNLFKTKLCVVLWVAESCLLA